MDRVAGPGRYLVSVEAGFNLRRGGTGNAIESFSVSAGDRTPRPPCLPMDARELLSARKAGAAGLAFDSFDSVREHVNCFPVAIAATGRPVYLR